MTTKIIFDEHRFEQTAKAVFRINRRGHSCWEGVRDYMKSRAESVQRHEPGTLGYYTTAGFVLTFWIDDKGEMNVFASVDAYSVLRYLEEKEGYYRDALAALTGMLATCYDTEKNDETRTAVSMARAVIAEAKVHRG